MKAIKKLSKTKVVDDVKWELTLLKKQKKVQSALKRMCLAAGLVALTPEKPTRMSEKKWELLDSLSEELSRTVVPVCGAIQLKKMFPKGYLTEEQERKLRGLTEGL